MTSGGEWEKWCTAAATYTWVRFKDVASATTGTPGDCGYWSALPLQRTGQKGGDLGQTAENGFKVEGNSAVLGPGLQDVAIYATKPAGTTTSLYLAAGPFPGVPKCMDLTPAHYLFLGFTPP